MLNCLNKLIESKYWASMLSNGKRTSLGESALSREQQTVVAFSLLREMDYGNRIIFDVLWTILI